MKAKMDELAKAGLIAAETRRDLLSNLLVIVMPSQSKLVIVSPEDLVNKSQKVAVADPWAVLSFRSELISALQL
jgi:molybdate transport system substrate-binding protein